MALTRARQTENPSQISHLAPARLLAPPGCLTWHLREGGVYDEQELLEHIQQFCREYSQRLASQLLFSSYQSLPPEAVSMFDPPERAWLVRLQMVGHKRDQTTGQVEVIVVLRGGEARIIFR